MTTCAANTLDGNRCTVGAADASGLCRRHRALAVRSTKRNVRPQPLADPLTAAPAAEAVVVVASAVVSVPDVSTGYRQQIERIDGDPRDNDVDNLRIVDAPTPQPLASPSPKQSPNVPAKAPTAPLVPLDPLDPRITAAKALTELLAERDGIVAERRRLIAELRGDGWPMAAIAEAIGISRVRAYSIMGGKGEESTTTEETKR